MMTKEWQEATAVIRPICNDDLDALIDIVSEISAGVTSLPKDKDLLKKKIYDSSKAFAEEVATPANESYLFVLQHSDTPSVIGVSGLLATVGTAGCYQIDTIEKSSKAIGIHMKIKVLYLTMVRGGPSEVCSLCLAKQWREKKMGLLLSLSRFLFIRAFPERFGDKVIGRMRGVIDKQLRSPFWDVIGKNFFDIDFSEADYIAYTHKDAIIDLIPAHPIYVSLLPPSVQEVIGKSHANTIPAQKLLEKEHFTCSDYVDLFDGGPIFEASTKTIRTISQAKTGRIQEICDDSSAGEWYLASNLRLDFRCTVTQVLEKEEGLAISLKTANVLQIKKGEEIQYVPLPTKSSIWK
ncbi:arginine N-succinyltransferase [Simkania negevensis]|uniref:Arginine N-succinyltransferase n=1 Tax=Simkania negevensis TaxID=83561 RepID=A0ABS3AQD2_9BACT|nr:arginine N-succinyltransferase [Simkania negevensis]